MLILNLTDKLVFSFSKMLSYMYIISIAIFYAETFIVKNGKFVLHYTYNARVPFLNGIVLE